MAIPVTDRDDDRSYCDGWEAGFETGYTRYYVINRKIKPLFITPICPISRVGFDTYQDGYNRGLLAGKKKFKKRNPNLDFSEND